jgi:hypothetical protein
LARLNILHSELGWWVPFKGWIYGPYATYKDAYYKQHLLEEKFGFIPYRSYIWYGAIIGYPPNRFDEYHVLHDDHKRECCRCYIR